MSFCNFAWVNTDAKKLNKKHLNFAKGKTSEKFCARPMKRSWSTIEFSLLRSLNREFSTHELAMLIDQTLIYRGHISKFKLED